MGNWPNTFRVSVKGVVLHGGKVLLLLNERNEWELPGGGLERDESPQECVVREIQEETGWEVRCEEILDSWLYIVGQTGEEALIVTYGCTLLSDAVMPQVSWEHTELRLFPLDEVDRLTMPQGYRSSIVAWSARVAASNMPAGAGPRG